jgi:hypothetical protein
MAAKCHVIGELAGDYPPTPSSCAAEPGNVPQSTDPPRLGPSCDKDTIAADQYRPRWPRPGPHPDHPLASAEP